MNEYHSFIYQLCLDNLDPYKYMFLDQHGIIRRALSKRLVSKKQIIYLILSDWKRNEQIR